MSRVDAIVQAVRDALLAFDDASKVLGFDRQTKIEALEWLRDDVDDRIKDLSKDGAP